MQEVALVEDLAVDVRVLLAQLTHLAILLRDELLVHRGDLDVQLLVRKEEVRLEVARGSTGLIELDGEGVRFVLPLDSVEVEESGELPLTVVSEIGECGLGDLEVEARAQLLTTSVAAAVSETAASGNSSWRSPSSSSSTGPTAMPKTPCPPLNTSTTSVAL